MVTVLVYGSRGPGSRPLSASLRPRVYMCSGELNAGEASHPGGVEILICFLLHLCFS